MAVDYENQNVTVKRGEKATVKVTLAVPEDLTALGLTVFIGKGPKALVAPILALTVGTGGVTGRTNAGVFYWVLTRTNTVALGAGNFNWEAWDTDGDAPFCGGRLEVVETIRP